jgi:S-formylglutathione hydrolase FrmB
MRTSAASRPGKIAGPLLAAVTASLLAFAGSAFAQSSAPRVESHWIESPGFTSRQKLVVYLPPGYMTDPAEPYPVLYFLHGLGNSPDDFVSRGTAEQTDRLIESGRIPPLVIAKPAGGVSYYVNRHDGGAPYEDLANLEAPAFVEATYAVRRDAGGRAITGISMGGYGALKIALRYPGRYGSVSAHTPFLMEGVPEGEGTDRTSRMFMNVMRTLYGDPIDAGMWRANNPFELAGKPEVNGLPIYFTAASRDRYGLQIPAEAFHRRLVELKVPHEFVAFEGVHGWESLLDRWEDFLKFHTSAFRPIGAVGAN